MTTAAKLITAEEYARMPDLGYPSELVRGEIVERDSCTARHGEVCTTVGCLLGNSVAVQGLGHTVCNAGIITERDPDTVRRGEAWFISYTKVPKGPLPQDYLNAPPDIVVEVKSVFECWNEILGQVAEYLRAGVAVVCVLDPESETARRYRDEEEEVVLKGDEAVTFPDELPGVAVAARKFFE